MRANALFAGGFLAVLAVLFVSGCAASTGTSGGGESACAAGAYQAIRAHDRLTGVPSACQGLVRSQLNAAASVAIKIAAGHGTKSARRARAGIAAGYVSVLITNSVPTAPVTSGDNGGAPAATAGSRLGFSDRAAQVGALLAWLAAAASGGWVLVRWWRAGGSLRRLRDRTATTAPPAVAIGHVCLGLLGLVLWGLFMITGQAALAWICVALLAPVAGLGMVVLVLGLPRPRPFGPAGTSLGTPPGTGTGGRRPVLVIAAHGLFAMAALLMAALAAIGAG
jgi:hypothetical protein